MEFNFKEAASVRAVQLHWVVNAKHATALLSYVEAFDGKEFKTVAAKYSPELEAMTEIRFAPVTTTRLRVYQPAGMGANHIKGWMWLTEVEVY